MTSLAPVAAAVDIGTNSVKLTVARRGEILYDATRITRLGKKVDASGRLDPEAVARTLAALAEMGAAARERGAARIAAVGTSALRDASDGAAFVAAAAEALGGVVEVISGEREARLTYLAARRDPDLALPDDRPVATCDIGGGSTEIVLGEGDALRFFMSLQLGAVRLTERALPSDPPTPAERARAGQMADDALAAVPSSDGALLVASGGTAANLAGIARGRLDPAAIHGQRLTAAQIVGQVDALAALPLAARRDVPGLEPERADVIVAGALILARTLHRLGAPAAIVSARGLRYGLLYELLDSAA